VRSHAAGAFSLILDGANQGALHAFGGGNPYAEQTRKMTAELYCERMELQIG
jgi:hypothetical protein